MPLDDEMIADLQAWRLQTAYAKDGNWVFASSHMNGKTAALAGRRDEESHSAGGEAGWYHSASVLAHFSAYLH